MEADSTTIDNSSKAEISEPGWPFIACPGNFKLYKDFSSNIGETSLEVHIVERLQDFGLLPKSVKCPSGKPECKVISKNARRVIDRVQWVCEGCSKRLPIRKGSFFMGLPCSLLQALQMVLAWCEDADCDAAAKHFDVKAKAATTIYNRMDELAEKEHSKYKLGGEDSVVLLEMYPDCLTRLSPDTTDQPHVHRILMVADTNHIPTSYHLHVMRDDIKKNSSTSLDNPTLVAEVEKVVPRVTSRQSMLVTCSNAPPVEGAITMQQLVQHCDFEMQHFLSSRLWRQAIALCVASRDSCAGAGAPYATAACAAAVQKYLDTSLYRLRHGDGFYGHALGLLAARYTEQCASAASDEVKGHPL